MKKWLFGLIALALIGYFTRSLLLKAVGITTTQVLVYNGNETTVDYSFNGKAMQLAPGEAKVFRTSQFSNKIISDQGNDQLALSFGAGQHFVNLGSNSLHIYEEYYRWIPESERFDPNPSKPLNRLLYDADHGQGLHTIDNCWDCCLLLKPNDRPYGYLKQEYKDKRLILSSIF